MGGVPQWLDGYACYRLIVTLSLVWTTSMPLLYSLIRYFIFIVNYCVVSRIYKHTCYFHNVTLNTLNVPYSSKMHCAAFITRIHKSDKCLYSISNVTYFRKIEDIVNTTNYVANISFQFKTDLDWVWTCYRKTKQLYNKTSLCTMNISSLMQWMLWGITTIWAQVLVIRTHTLYWFIYNMHNVVPPIDPCFIYW